METKSLKRTFRSIVGVIWAPIALCFFIFFALMAAIGVLGLGIPLWNCYHLKFKRHKGGFFLAITPKPKDVDIKPAP